MLVHEPIAVVDWGRTRYTEATQRQLAWVDRRLAGDAVDTLIFTEHEPVYTMGLRSGAGAHLLWGEAQLRAAGIEVEQTNRGGDITYHGPGQLVGYPIVSLAQVRDLHAYLRFLEQVLIDALAEMGVSAARRPGLTGIWIGTRKVAAIGVAVRRWIAYHGFALNVAPELRHFTGIVPCGIAATEGSVTSLAVETGQPWTLAQVQPIVAGVFRRRWSEFSEGSWRP